MSRNDRTKDWIDRINIIIKNNDIEGVKMLAQLIAESEEAKQTLRDKGYGWIGLSLLKTVEEEVPSCE